MKVREKPNLSRLFVYISIFVLVSIFTNLLFSTYIYRKELLLKTRNYANNLLLNSVYITDYSIYISNERFNYIYDNYTGSHLNSVNNNIEIDLPKFSVPNLVDIYRYSKDQTYNTNRQAINKIIDKNEAYNVVNDEDTLVFFNKDEAYQYPMIIIVKNLKNSDEKIVGLFKIIYETEFFKNSDYAESISSKYYFIIKNGSDIIAFNSLETDENIIGHVYTEDVDYENRKFYSIPSSNYNYRYQYYIDSSRSENPFFIAMIIFAVLNIVSFVIFIIIYNHYKISEIESATDTLTGLYNRRYLFAMLNSYIKRSSYPIAFIVLDIDCLKYINDTFGHVNGDKAIQKVANILRNVFRDGDIIARIGGDEFAVLLPKTSKYVVTMLIKRIIQFVENENQKDPDDLPISLTAGFYITNDNPKNLETLFVNADKSMYNNKVKSHKEYKIVLTKWCKKHNMEPPIFRK